MMCREVEAKFKGKMNEVPSEKKPLDLTSYQKIHAFFGLPKNINIPRVRVYQIQIKSLCYLILLYRIHATSKSKER